MTQCSAVGQSFLCSAHSVSSYSVISHRAATYIFSSLKKKYLTSFQGKLSPGSSSHGVTSRGNDILRHVWRSKVSESYGSRVSVSYLMTAFVSVQHYPLKQENCVRKECLQSVFLHSFFGKRNSASQSFCTRKVESS